jgi:hypothetical protein
MCWEVSTMESSTEQESDKNTNRRMGSLTALLGSEKETTTETTNTEGSESSNAKTNPFYLCPDPTCKEHIDTRCKLTRWKLRNASFQEYSDNEVKEIVKESMEQAIHDYHIVTENVETMYNKFGLDTPRNENSTEESIKTTSTAAGTNTDESSRTNHADTLMSRDPSLQIPRCEACERQEVFQEVSTTDASMEQDSDKNTDHTTHQMAFSLSVVPFVEVGGETESGDETVEKETSKFRTTDTVTFSICPEMTCESHLTTLSQMHCWELRTDSTREYADEEVDEIVEEQEIRDHAIVTETSETVSSTLLSDTSEIESKQTSSKNDKKSSEKTADGRTKSEKQAEGKTEKDEETEQTEQYDNNGDRYLDSYTSTGKQSDSKNKDNSKGERESM